MVAGDRADHDPHPFHGHVGRVLALFHLAHQSALFQQRKATVEDGESASLGPTLVGSLDRAGVGEVEMPCLFELWLVGEYVGIAGLPPEVLAYSAQETVYVPGGRLRMALVLQVLGVGKKVGDDRHHCQSMEEPVVVASLRAALPPKAAQRVGKDRARFGP